MASSQRLTSPVTGRISYRVQIRLRGHPSQSETFHNRKDGERWANSVESAILECRHFPYSRAQRISVASLAQRYRVGILTDASASTRANTERHVASALERFRALTLAEITPDRVADARNTLALQPYTRGKLRRSTDGEQTTPQSYKRTVATVNR
jgi:hypothetical protein